jgi:hypothetical protein
LLAVCEIADFSLLCISQEYVTAGQPDILHILGNLVYKSMKYGQELRMAAFCTGAILFYYLLYKSEIVPRVLSLWGLLAVIPCLVATVSALFGYDLPFLAYLPYVPFEFFIGVWILITALLYWASRHATGPVINAGGIIQVARYYDTQAAVHGK